ncbi:MAG TPA: winged helix-turn-helix transcriptional regulator, partial [Candidatus Thermoplasmatota archaeon]|nr:winged helix-turn-helix transcriptional regulator [Candidatus Thermoplasmatota archaeon]
LSEELAADSSSEGAGGSDRGGPVVVLAPKEGNAAGAPASISAAQAIGAATVAGAAAASGGLSWHHRRRWWPGLLALIHRLDPRRVRNQAVRRRILEVVQTEPGIHMGALRRLLGLQSGHLRHHLKILEDSGAIVSRNGGRYRCYFPDAASAARLGRSAGALKAARARELLSFVLTNPGHSVQEAESAMGAPEGGLDYHLRRLEEMNLMLTLRSAGRRWLFPTSAAQEAGALVEARPALLPLLVQHAA